MNTAILYISLFLLITSCGSKESRQDRELEKLATDVMAVHDRSMADHGKLFGYKKKLLAIDQTLTDSIIKIEIMHTITEIDQVDGEMMDWMHHYQTPEEFLPFDEKKAYYIDQKKRIEDIENRTNEAIEKAKQYIEKYPAN
jgi:hypothetical protein